jgi:tRNA G37 N-methylase Trm5
MAWDNLILISLSCTLCTGGTCFAVEHGSSDEGNMSVVMEEGVDEIEGEQKAKFLTLVYGKEISESVHEIQGKVCLMTFISL